MFFRPSRISHTKCPIKLKILRADVSTARLQPGENIRSHVTVDQWTLNFSPNWSTSKIVSYDLWRAICEQTVKFKWRLHFDK